MIHANEIVGNHIERIAFSKDQLSFGRKFYDVGNNRVLGQRAQEILAMINTQVAAVAFRYSDDYVDPSSDWQWLARSNPFSHLVSLPHSDAGLIVLRCIGFPRLQPTIFTSRKHGLESILKFRAEIEVGVSQAAKERASSYLNQLTDFFDGQIFLSRNAEGVDQVGLNTRALIFLLSEPGVIGSTELMELHSLIYSHLEKDCSKVKWTPGLHVIFGEYGFHCKRVSCPEEMNDQQNPLQGMQVRP